MRKEFLFSWKLVADGADPRTHGARHSVLLRLVIKEALCARPSPKRFVVDAVIVPKDKHISRVLSPGHNDGCRSADTIFFKPPIPTGAVPVFVIQCPVTN